MLGAGRGVRSWYAPLRLVCHVGERDAGQEGPETDPKDYDNVRHVMSNEKEGPETDLADPRVAGVAFDLSNQLPRRPLLYHRTC
eukprot:1560970-Rhodomonas_salina.1